MNARRRIRFLENYDLGPNGKYEAGQNANTPNNPNDADDPPTFPRPVDLEWWQRLATTWGNRYWCNPFVSSTPYDRTQPNINAKSIAQRQQILAQGCSQFIVEFAGDFVTQNLNSGLNYGNVTAAVPDGVLDFVAVSGTTGTRITRWYGLPRDVDGDGHIWSTNAAGSRTSIDVLPVSVFAGSDRLPFERKSKSLATVPAIAPPTANSDYATLLDEPTTADNPDDSGYVCVWGPQDFERVYTNTTPPVGTVANPAYFRGAYPTLIRFVVDVLDEDGKLAEPVRQELVFRVPDELPQAAN